MEQRLNNYDILKESYLFDTGTSENQTAIKILFGGEPQPGRTTPTGALKIILETRESYPHESIGFKNSLCSDTEDIEFEKAFCTYNNTEAKSDSNFVAIDCNRWIEFFKYLRKLVLNPDGIVGGVSVSPGRGGGRKSTKRRKSMKKLHRRK